MTLKKCNCNLLTMNKINTFTLLIISLPLALFSQGRVDGFFKGKGNLDLVFGGGYEANDKYFAGTTKRGLTRNVTFFNTFVAYGITDKLDVNASLPYIDVNGVENDFQDYAIYLKHNTFVKNGWSISLAMGFSSNLVDYQTEEASAIGQQAKTIDGRLVVQRFFSESIFVMAQGGYSYKNNPVPNAIPFALKLGWAKANYYIDVWYDFQHSIGGFDYRGDPSPTTFRSLGVSYHKIGGTF